MPKKKPTDVDPSADLLTNTSRLSAPKPEDGPQPDEAPPREVSTSIKDA